LSELKEDRIFVVSLVVSFVENYKRSTKLAITFATKKRKISGL